MTNALFGDETSGKSEFELLPMLSEKTGWSIPEGLRNLEEKEVLHKTVCEKDNMVETVMRILEIE